MWGISGNFRRVIVNSNSTGNDVLYMEGGGYDFVLEKPNTKIKNHLNTYNYRS